MTQGNCGPAPGTNRRWQKMPVGPVPSPRSGARRRLCLVPRPRPHLAWQLPLPGHKAKSPEKLSQAVFPVGDMMAKLQRGGRAPPHHEQRCQRWDSPRPHCQRWDQSAKCSPGRDLPSPTPRCSGPEGPTSDTTTAPTRYGQVPLQGSNTRVPPPGPRPPTVQPADPSK